jgi:ATP-dependent DNA helicase PIF1
MEQSLSPPPSPNRHERAASFISISSDEDESDNREVIEPTLCREQQELVDLIMSGRNVFFTGSAGCGKSTVLKAAIDQLKAQGKRVVVATPTGKAALNVDGITLFSYLS